MAFQDGKLFGRGATDDKAPVLGWINAIETMQQLKIDLPVNMKVDFCVISLDLPVGVVLCCKSLLLIELHSLPDQDSFRFDYAL